MSLRFLLFVCLSVGVSCGGSAGPTFFPSPDAGLPAVDGGAPPSDGGAPSADGGASTDGGAVAYADCPAPVPPATAKSNVVVLNPLDGQISKRFDLTCFAENAGLPRPANLLLVRDKMYVALQDFDVNFSNFKTTKLVVIDTQAERVLRKVELAGRKNVSDLDLGPDGLVYVTTQGILGLDFPGFTVEPELSGGVDILDPLTDTLVRRIDDDAFGGNVTRVEVASPTRAYAVVAVFDATGSPRENHYFVKRFNPATGVVEPTALYAATGSFVSGLVYDAQTASVYVAEGDFLDPRIVTLRDSDGTVDAARRIPLSLTPQSMDLFVRGPERKLVVVEPDFAGGVGAVQTVDVSRAPPFVVVTAPEPVSSDPIVRILPIPGVLPQVPQAYVINRFQADNIQWLDPDSAFATRRLGGVAAQWSTGNGSNPQDVAPVSPTKLYVSLQQ